MSAPTASKLTYWDLARWPDDGHPYQLIDGEAVMTPSPTPRHQRVVLTLGSLLRSHAEERRLGEVFVAPLDVVLDEHNVLQPDVFFVRRDRSIITSANVWGAPDLAIEVLSPGTAWFDRGKKQEKYAAAGVPEVWYVDPQAETVEVYRLGPEGRYVAIQTASGDEPISSSVLPEWRRPARDVFA